MSVLEAVRKANQPGPPEDSVRLRAAATAGVLVGIAACSAQYEISRSTGYLAGALIVAGMIFSYATRSKPPGYIKMVAAVAAVSLLASFVNALSGGQITDITAVEDPLSVLFVGIQVVHSFHVPSRRDLLFTIAGAAGLMALAGAQSIDLSFAYYAVPWLSLTLWSLIELWRSASGGARVSPHATSWSLVGVGAAALVVFLLLPAPTVSVRIGFISRPGDGGPLSSHGALAGDSGSPSQLSRPGSPAGRSRVGGYLGFANHLDTALRRGLGKTLVMRVRAERPSYWIGETYDRWDGQNWISTTPAKKTLRDGSPFYVPVQEDVPPGQSDLQTFYVVDSSPNLVFHADTAHQVWFPAPSLIYGQDGTIVSPLALGKGAVYTVQSYVDSPGPAQLRAAGDSSTSSGQRVALYTQLPHSYPRVGALARSATAGATNTYDTVQALIGWIGSHTRYSTDIPPLPAGADTVDQFLFGTRVGFCEQISTSLAVMLRSLGIPAREAVGYVPGSYNPVTDLYDVRAEDAHAWVQVWFPGYGWQSFDPTASVPLANPSPGATALKDVGHALAGIPVVPAGVGFGGVGGLVVVMRWRRRRPRTWHERVLREMEGAGRRVGRHRNAPETLFEYAEALDRTRPAGAAGPPGPAWRSVAEEVARGTYGASHPTVEEQIRIAAEARRIRRGTARRVPALRGQAGQSAVGLLVTLLILGGIAAVVVVVSLSGGSPTGLPSLPSLTSGATHGYASVPTGLHAAEIAACQADYAAETQALAAYQAVTGHPPSAIDDLKPYLRDLPAANGFTISMRSGALAVSTPGHSATLGSANCSFAGQ